MKKILMISLCVLFLTTGCLGVGEGEDSARAKVAVKNAKSVITNIKYNYTLDKTSTPVGVPVDILSIPNASTKVDSGTYTILDESADSDISKIRLDNVIINNHTCSGTKEDMICVLRVQE